MIITEITPYDKKRSKVLTDEGLAFLLYNGELRRLGLRVDKELTQETYNDKIIPIFLKRARERLVYILKMSDKSEGELRKKLTAGFYPQIVIDASIEWAKSKHYVDDERYVENYIECYGRRKSNKKIMYDLTLKGIPKELISNTLEEKPIDEDVQIIKELHKKKFIPGETDNDTTRKIMASLARKGYSYEAIRRNLKADIDQDY